MLILCLKVYSCTWHVVRNLDYFSDSCEILETMENGVGRINTLRSLVRPVSPLSRMQNLPYLTDDQNQATISTKRGLGPVNRSRSPSPVLASAVHLARPRASDTDTYPQILNPDGETRRIIVRRPDPSMEIDNLNPAHNAHVDPSCELDFGNNPDGRGSLRRRRSGEADGPRPPPSIAVSTVDREKTCPILIRVSYTTNGRHTPLSEYDKGRFPRNGFSMNTWRVLSHFPTQFGSLFFNLFLYCLQLLWHFASMVFHYLYCRHNSVHVF